MIQHLIARIWGRRSSGIATLAVVAAALVVAACSSSGSGLTGKTWELTAITEKVPAFQGVIPPADQGRYTIQFLSQDAFVARADCNTVTGTYQTSRSNGLELTLGPSTLAACPEGSFADQYVVGLATTESYAATDEQLILNLKAGGTMTFQAAPADTSATPAASAGAVASASATPTAKPTAKPSATPTARPTAKPTAKPTATPKPAATPTANPPVVVPTAKPTPTPTAAPTTKTCTTADGRVTVAYPAAWYTIADVPEFACMFFDPKPVAIDPASGQPVAAVRVTPTDAVTYDQAFLAATDTKLWKSISKTATTVSGLDATQITATANGAGAYPAGTVRYGYLVDWGSNGIVGIDTTAPEGDPSLAGNEAVVDQIAQDIVIRK
jgi:heat shock protein HslJ